MEGEKFKLRTCLRGLYVLLRTRSAQRLSSPHLAAVLRGRASAFWFFLYTNMVFEAVRIYFPKKNTRVYGNTVTCVTCLTSNRVEVRRLNSQHLAMVQTSNMAELMPSGVFCLQPWFLQRSEHNRELKQPRRRREGKRHFKNNFTIF